MRCHPWLLLCWPMPGMAQTKPDFEQFPPPYLAKRNRQQRGNRLMDKIIDLSKVALETNSPLWRVREVGEEPILQVIGNTEEDHIGGKVALIGKVRRNYTMQAEMRFLGHHLLQERAGWFGFTMRAQDVQNYELVWFMPILQETQLLSLRWSSWLLRWYRDRCSLQAGCDRGSPIEVDGRRPSPLAEKAALNGTDIGFSGNVQPRDEALPLELHSRRPRRMHGNPKPHSRRICETMYRQRRGCRGDVLVVSSLWNMHRLAIARRAGCDTTLQPVRHH